MIITTNKTTAETVHDLLKSPNPANDSFRRIYQFFSFYSGSYPSITFVTNDEYRSSYDEDNHCQELNFQVYALDFDEHGRAITDPDYYWNPPDGCQHNHILAGGWINHGTFDAPDWSSHT